MQCIQPCQYDNLEQRIDLRKKGKYTSGVTLRETLPVYKIFITCIYKLKFTTCMFDFFFKTYIYTFKFTRTNLTKFT